MTNGKIAFFFIVVLLLGGAAISGLAYRSLHEPVSLSVSPVSFEIRAGSSLRQVAVDLRAMGLVDSVIPLVMYARATGQSGQIKAGEYHLFSGQTVVDMFAAFVAGHVVQHAFTIIEGWTVSELLEALAAEPKIKHTLDEDLAPSLLTRQLGFVEQAPEGLFFADTYFYARNASSESLLKRAYLRMQQVLSNEWEKRDKSLPYKNAYEALIMASIVEKETSVAREREAIAGVFVKRLKKGMRLQTDPSVIYGLGKNYKGNLTRKHLRTKTAYNTYRVAGLPPTPIALPGRESIYASLHPREDGALYFVAKGDGTHYFSENFKAHREAVKKFQWKRRRDYRSTPVGSSTKAMNK